MTDTTAGEGVLSNALGQIVDLCPATCETSLAHEMADIAREALAAQPSAGARGEAVAWQVREQSGTYWSDCRDPEFWRERGWEVRALGVIATPAQPDTGDAQ